MKSIPSLWAVLLMLLLSFSLKAEEAEHSYISCAIISSEHLTTLQLYQRGVPLTEAIATLPRLSRAAEKRVRYVYELANNIGILNSYADINTNFARCSTLVYKKHGKPAIDQQEYGYYFCSGENKVRYEIILYTDRYQTLEKVIEKTPDSHLQTVIDYYKLIENKGILAAFDLTANNLKACLNRLQSPS